jgi:hypothetical protein
VSIINRIEKAVTELVSLRSAEWLAEHLSDTACRQRKALGRPAQRTRISKAGQTKPCELEGCENLLTRTPRMSEKQWAGKHYCSNLCSGLATAAKRRADAAATVATRREAAGAVPCKRCARPGCVQKFAKPAKSTLRQWQLQKYCSAACYHLRNHPVGVEVAKPEVREEVRPEPVVEMVVEEARPEPVEAERLVPREVPVEPASSPTEPAAGDPYDEALQDRIPDLLARGATDAILRRTLRLDAEGLAVARRIKQERMLAARRQRDAKMADMFVHKGF